MRFFVISILFSGKHALRQQGPHLDSFRKHQALEKKRHGAQLAPVLSRRPLVDQKRWSLAESCLSLADRCLFTMRLELHSHLFYFLSEMQSGAYWCAQDSVEPESFVLDLNRDLCLVDEAVGEFLLGARRRYVFGGTAELMTAILVRNMAHLQHKRVNQRGVAKISRNFFALQQNLTNIEGATSSSMAASSPSGAAAPPRRTCRRGTSTARGSTTSCSTTRRRSHSRNTRTSSDERPSRAACLVAPARH